MFIERKTGEHTHSMLFDAERTRKGGGQKAHIYRKPERDIHALTYNNSIGKENLG